MKEETKTTIKVSVKSRLTGFVPATFTVLIAMYWKIPDFSMTLTKIIIPIKKSNVFTSTVCRRPSYGLEKTFAMRRSKPPAMAAIVLFSLPVIMKYITKAKTAKTKIFTTSPRKVHKIFLGFLSL